MKKTGILVLCASLLFGCAGKNGNNSSSSAEEEKTDVTYKAHKGDAYESYTASLSSAQTADSYTAAINSTYVMSYSDETKDVFLLDGVLEVTGGDSPTAHSTQNIEANGGSFKMEGYWYDGRLYNSYNDVTYYEDMDLSDLKKSMIVPMEAYQYPDAMIESITAKDGNDGTTVYTLVLKQDQAADLFSERYDSYGLNAYENYTVKENTITDTFDAEGHLIEENVTFDTSVSYQGQNIDVKYTSYVKYLKINETEVNITKDMKKEQKSYVSYDQIDTSAIVTETDAYDDSPEKTVTETFKKRLVNRLGYEVADDGSYQISYNGEEAYIIDFDNKTFTYSNCSIRYTYNWRGNIGTMGKCTLTFKDGAESSDCEDTTVEMIRKVKTFLEMELYYCGLSLDDLQKESD